MGKIFLSKFILLCFIFTVLTACDNQVASNSTQKKQVEKEEAKIDDAYKAKKREQEESSKTATTPPMEAPEVPQKRPSERRNRTDFTGEQTKKNESEPDSSSHFNKKNYQGNGNNPQKRKAVPAGWIDRNVQKKTSAANQQIWENIISAIDRLIFARKVIYAPIGTQSSDLKSLADGKYKVSVRCIVIEQNGDQTPYLLECVAVANHYDASVIKLEFEEPSI